MDYSKYKLQDVAYPNRTEFKKSLIQRIKNQKLTQSEYWHEIDGVGSFIDKWYKAQMQIIHNEENRLRELFWADARKELEYDRYLTSEGVKILESKAWSDGHAGGYEEVFNTLQELDEFLSEIKNHLKN